MLGVLVCFGVFLCIFSLAAWVDARHPERFLRGPAGSIVLRGASSAWAVALLLVLGCRGASPLADHDQARSLVGELRLQFAKTDKASTQAVMADTDEASIAFAKDAQQASASLDGKVAALSSLLRRLRYAREQERLQAFEADWAKYRELQGRILALAVENTNLKAQRLSFGPAREAADAFRDAVTSAARAAPASDACAASQLASTAILSVREIQVLLAPHIAEADDAAMTRLEEQMAALEQRATEAVRQLSVLSGANALAGSADARVPWERFKELRKQIVGLSRQNTNVRSLALSLREQATLARACDDSLRLLQQSLNREGQGASR